MKTLILTATHEEIMDGTASSIGELIDSCGYRYFDGELEQYIDPCTMLVVRKYRPGRRDILFQEFDRWTPDWKKKRDILFRRFK